MLFFKYCDILNIAQYIESLLYIFQRQLYSFTFTVILKPTKMSQYPNSGNNQWGNINQNQNQNNNYAYGYENTNNATNNKPQINTYGYPDNSNTQNNNSGWGQSPIQQQQNLPTNWQANNNTNVYQNNNSGWGKPMGNTQNYGYGDIKSNNSLWDETAKVNFSMDKMNIVGSSSSPKIIGMDNISKLIDWDQALRQKNLTKQRSDTSWITYQEQSWKKQKPSDAIQHQVLRKFAFPNPYIKYKIIPGVDQKKALDVTSKDELDKGLVKGNLIIWDYHGGPNQQFYIQRIINPNNFTNGPSETLDQDEFLLINASTGFCVSTISQTNTNKISKNNNNNQKKLCVYPKLGNNEVCQRWKLKRFKQSQDIYLIGWAGNNGQTVLDCQNQSSSNGTNVVQWTSNGGKNQLWKILPA